MSYGDQNCKCTADNWCGCLDNPMLDEILAVEHARSQARENIKAVEVEMASAQPGPSVPMVVQWLSFVVGMAGGVISLALPIPPGYSILIGGAVMILALPALMLWHESRSNRPVNVPVPDTGVKIGVNHEQKRCSAIVEIEPTETTVTLVSSTAQVIPFPQREDKVNDEAKQEVA